MLIIDFHVKGFDKLNLTKAFNQKGTTQFYD